MARTPMTRNPTITTAAYKTKFSRHRLMVNEDRSARNATIPTSSKAK